MTVKARFQLTFRRRRDGSIDLTMLFDPSLSIPETPVIVDKIGQVFGDTLGMAGFDRTSIHYVTRSAFYKTSPGFKTALNRLREILTGLGYVELKE